MITIAVESSSIASLISKQRLKFLFHFGKGFSSCFLSCAGVFTSLLKNSKMAAVTTIATQHNNLVLTDGLLTNFSVTKK
jgi:hypothetical protein